MNSLRTTLSARMPRALRRLARSAEEELREDYYRARVRLTRPGVRATPRATPLIVSLTSIPSRVADRADVTIATLLGQRTRPDRLILWLDERLQQMALPRSFRALVAAGLEVRYRPDIGPHTKLIHALREHPDAVIVTADDDMYYPVDWLSSLYASYQRAPTEIHCHRAHYMRLTDGGRLAPYHDWALDAPGMVGPDQRLFPTGVGGVLYPPGSLSPEVFDIDAFRRLCPTADDVWFKAMALLQGTPARKVRPYWQRLRPVRGTQDSRLYVTNISGNDEQLRATFDAYDLYRRLADAGA